MRIRNAKMDESGKEVRVMWKEPEWRKAAGYFLLDIPLLCEYEELKGITQSDMLRMQIAVLPPEMHRTKGGFNDMIGNRKKLRTFIDQIKAEAITVVQVVQEIPLESAAEVRELPPQADIPEVKAAIAEVLEEHDEGESQLMFFGAVGNRAEIVQKPAVEKVCVTLPGPTIIGAGVLNQIFSKPLTPRAAMQAVSEMSLDAILDLLSDRVADKVADRVAAKMSERMAAIMQVNPVHAPVKAVASVVSKPVVTEPSHTLKAQLAVAVKSMPKPKKPKIIIIGMQGAQANEIEKEFPKFEIVHLLHGNDKIKDKIKSAQKVLGIEQKLGSSAKMIKEMHGSNFVMLKFGMTNIRHQLGIWETCYLQDPTYFNMSEAERVNYS